VMARFNVLAVTVLVALAGAACAQEGPSCSLVNGLVVVQNIPSSTLCIRRSDGDETTSFGTSLIFGALSKSNSLSVSFYADLDCTQIFGATIPCVAFPSTICTLDGQNRIIVQNLEFPILSVRRGDTGECSSAISNDVLTFATPTTADLCPVQLNLFSDANCRTFLQSSQDVLCPCPMAYSYEATASCVVANGIIQVQNIPSATTCVGRSDIPFKALAPFPGNMLNFGGLVSATNTNAITLTFFDDAQCQTPASTITCTTLAPTECTINSDDSVTVTGIEPPVQSIRRGDTGECINNFSTSFTSTDITLALTSTMMCPGFLQINLFSDLNCRMPVNTNHEVGCNCYAE